MLGFLKWNCDAGILDNKALNLLYVTLVHVHLRLCYHSQDWQGTSVIKNILLIESVQRGAMMVVCKHIEL